MTPDEVMLAKCLFAVQYGHTIKRADQIPEDEFKTWIPAAKKLKEALSQAGYVIVPAEPTDAMIEAAHTYNNQAWIEYDGDDEYNSFIHYKRLYQAMIKEQGK